MSAASLERVGIARITVDGTPTRRAEGVHGFLVTRAGPPVAGTPCVAGEPESVAKIFRSGP